MKYTKYIIGILLTVVLFVALSQWSQQHAVLLQDLTTQAGFVGVLSYILIMAASIVFAPLGTAFLLPVAATSYGPFWAAIYSIVGWTIGSLGAFFIARHFGFKKYKETEFMRRIQSYEASVPRLQFYGLIILFRIALPVDGVSYALGFVSTISYPAFLMTTILGITPLAFVFTFATTLSATVQLTVGVSATLLFLSATYVAYRGYINNPDPKDVS